MSIGLKIGLKSFGRIFMIGTAFLFLYNQRLFMVLFTALYKMSLPVALFTNMV